MSGQMRGAAYLSWAEGSLPPEDARRQLTGPGSPFEMTSGDVLGSPMPVFSSRVRTARQMLLASAERLGDQPFLVFPDRTYTYRGIQRPIAAMAAVLRRHFGVGPGDRVGIVAANVPGHAITAWAVVFLGAVVVELNAWWTGPEVVHGITLTRPKVVFGDRRRLERLRDGSVDVPLVCLEDDFDRLVEEFEGSPLPEDTVGEDDPLCILFTSGTTGRPKGAVLSHRSHVHMMMQATLQGALGVMANAQEADLPSGPPVSIGVSPMFHISGFSVALIGGSFTGSTIVYPPPGRWEPEVHLELTQRYRATSWAIVPTQLWRLVEHPRIAEFDLSSLTRVGGGGSTFSPELWRKVRALLPSLRMGTGYGMTETCGAGTHQDGVAALQHPDAVGAPVPGYEICIRGSDGGRLAVGEVGEIHLRGPCNFLGYWDDPDATAAVLDGDRWYRSGELGRIDDGLVFLEGRGTDLIIRGGENIYPIEIENRLVEHPAIVDAAVIGVPDRVLGEQVKAVVVLREDARITLDEVQAWVAEMLAGFKVPVEMETRAELPRNAAGKVLKNLLKAALPEERHHT